MRDAKSKVSAPTSSGPRNGKIKKIEKTFKGAIAEEPRECATHAEMCVATIKTKEWARYCGNERAYQLTQHFYRRLKEKLWSPVEIPQGMLICRCIFLTCHLLLILFYSSEL